MNIITKAPIIYGEYEDYLSLDGTSTKDEILAFQKWANSKGEKLLEETGIFDASTTALYNKVKARYEREIADMNNNVQKLAFKKNAPVETTQVVSEIVPQTWNVNIKRPSWWGRQSPKNKTLIIVGSVFALSITSYLIYKNSKK